MTSKTLATSLLALSAFALACGAGSCAPPPQPPPVAARYGYRVVNAFPHDPGAFTQGLLYADGHLYESTGMYADSSVRRVDLETGEVLAIRALPQAPSGGPYFGEGLALRDGKLYQLTWRHRTGFIYDQETLDLEGEFSYTTEGWGLTYDGTHFILSDGSAYLRFFDPAIGFGQAVRAIRVEDAEGPVENLNELEYIDGEIYANVWKTDYIVRINPVGGEVISWIDLTGLLSEEIRTGSEDVLNGIAYDADNDRLFVTGKYWPLLFEIELIPEAE